MGDCCQHNECKFINYNKWNKKKKKRAMHFILKEGQHWIHTYGINFPDGTMQWPTKDLVIAYRDNKEMLESNLARTSVHFEPIINIAVLFNSQDMQVCKSKGRSKRDTFCILFIFITFIEE